MSTTDTMSHSSHSTTDTSHESSTSDHQSSPMASSAHDSTAHSESLLESCPTTSSESVPDPHSAIASGDLGEVVKLKSTMEYKLTDMDKYKLLTEHYIPAPNHPFPACTIGGTVRHFQHSWLTKYPGLVYSLAEDGGFCKYCVLFSNPEPSVTKLGVLVTRPLQNFKKATEILNDHFYASHKKGRKSHQVAYEKALNFISVFENQSLSIASQLSVERDRQIAENRLKLISIVETIFWGGSSRNTL